MRPAAEDGEAGDARAADHPDLVILDLELPQAGRHPGARAAEGGKTGLPVVMLTGPYEVRAAVRAMRLGAYDYLTKPFDSEEMTIVVGRAMEIPPGDRGR